MGVCSSSRKRTQHLVHSVHLTCYPKRDIVDLQKTIDENEAKLKLKPKGGAEGTQHNTHTHTHTPLICDEAGNAHD